MHSHTIRGRIERCHQSDYFEIRGLPEQTQSPGAIFSAAPGKQDSFHAASPIHCQWTPRVGASNVVPCKISAMISAVGETVMPEILHGTTFDAPTRGVH